MELFDDTINGHFIGIVFCEGMTQALAFGDELK